MSEVQFAQTVTAEREYSLENLYRRDKNKPKIVENILCAIQQASIAAQYPLICKREINAAIDYLKTAVALVED